MLKVAKYVVYDILRGKVAAAYTLLLLVISISLFGIQSDPSKSIVSLMSVVIIIVPLVSAVFSTTYFYNSYEFIELLVAQPISRITILLGVYIGVAFSLSAALFTGIGIPVLIFSYSATGIMVAIAGLGLSLSFVSIAFLASLVSRDKARGIGLTLMLWFYFSVIYDGLVLAFLFAFNDYPLDKAVIALASLNPVDLGRIMILLKLDISALMGFTGAVYKKFFGGSFGIIYSAGLMILWVILPLALSVRIFKKKDL